MKNIPRKVKIIYYPEGEFSLIYPIDYKNAKVAKVNNIKYIIQKYTKPSGKPEEIEISNTGFKVSFIEPSTYPRWLQNDSRDFFCIPMFLYHPELDSIGRKFIVFVDLKGLLEYLPNLDMVSGEISGYFCLEEKLYLSGVSGVSLLLEDDEIKEDRDLNNLFESSVKTKNWKAGYTYILPNKNIILCLGYLKEISRLYTNRKFFSKSPGHPVICSTKYFGPLEYTEGYLYIDLNELSEDFRIQLNSEKGNMISGFLERWIKFIYQSNPFLPLKLLGKIYFNKRIGAVECQKFLEDDLGENLSSCLSDNLIKFANTKPSPEKYEFLTDCDFSKFSDTEQDEIIKYNVEKKLIPGIKSSIEETILPKPVNVESLIISLNQEISSKRIVGCHLMGFIYSKYLFTFVYLTHILGEDRLRKILEDRFNDIIS